jgi:hypothetical protein
MLFITKAFRCKQVGLPLLSFLTSKTRVCQISRSSPRHLFRLMERAFASCVPSASVRCDLYDPFPYYVDTCALNMASNSSPGTCSTPQSDNNALTCSTVNSLNEQHELCQRCSLFGAGFSSEHVCKLISHRIGRELGKSTFGLTWNEARARSFLADS